MTSYDTLLAANAPGWAIADALEEEGRTELAELYRVPRLRLIEPLLDLLTGGYLVPERFYDDLNRLLIESDFKHGHRSKRPFSLLSQEPL